MTLQTQATAPAPRIRVPLCDLGVAPENLRASEPEDEDVPRLAETIRAAGLIYPPIVRKGRRGEARFMVLDGRRRRFALLRLAAAGAIGPDQEVECVLAGDRAAQAAAAVLPNAEHAPVHLADVIVAIGKLRRSRLATDAIARALGYDETEVRRLEAVARVHPQVLQAFRQGRLTLRQVRLFARLKDRARQAELAEAALGGWFNEAALRAQVTGGRVTVEDPRFALVSEAAYVAVGGRLDVDLFGELAAEVLDPDRLEDLWRTAAARIGQGLAAEGLELFLARERGFRAPDGLDHLPFVHWGSLDDDAQAAFGAAQGVVETALEALEAAAADADADAERDALFAEVLRARWSWRACPPAAARSRRCCCRRCAAGWTPPSTSGRRRPRRRMTMRRMRTATRRARTTRRMTPGVPTSPFRRSSWRSRASATSSTRPAPPWPGAA
jgi:ParB family chromosome partitioning protein